MSVRLTNCMQHTRMFRCHGQSTRTELVMILTRRAQAHACSAAISGPGTLSCARSRRPSQCLQLTCCHTSGAATAIIRTTMSSGRSCSVQRCALHRHRRMCSHGSSAGPKPDCTWLTATPEAQQEHHVMTVPLVPLGCGCMILRAAADRPLPPQTLSPSQELRLFSLLPHLGALLSLL